MKISFISNKYIFLICLLFLFLLITIVYLPLFKGFFQLDEWTFFGDIFSRNDNFLKTSLGFFAPNKDHYVPIFQIIFYIYIKLFKFNFVTYALLSILGHLIVVLLLYLFVLKIFKNKILAFISSAFFGLSSSLHQATSWVLVDINSHYSAIFAILSLILFWDFLVGNKSKKLFFSLLFLIISLLIKESAVGFFILYPIVIILFNGLNIKKQISNFLPILLTGLTYLSLRVSMYFIPGAYAERATVFQMQSINNVILNVISFPAKVMLQTIFPPRVFLDISKFATTYLPRWITGIPGTTRFDIFVEQVSLQIISSVALIVIFIIVFRLWQKNGGERLMKLSLFGLFFVVLNSFIYAFSPGRLGLVALVDSRNLYLPSIGTVIFITSLLAFLTKKMPSRIIIFILPLILLQAVSLNKEILKISKEGGVRKGILYQIKDDYSKLPNKVVFYTESDTSFYGMPESEKILPFEVGFGQTLLDWYVLDQKFSRVFFENKFLWDLTSQGYKEDGNQGFGYFRNLDLLKQVILDKHLTVDSIIAYKYYSSSNNLVNITDETRGKVLKALPSSIKP